MAVVAHYDDLPMNWVGDWAGRRAVFTPGRPALYEPDSDTRLTYAQMNSRANRAGTWLVDGLGLRKGDKICFIARNRLEIVDLYLACGKTGVILAPLSYRLTKRELDDLLQRIQPQLLVYEEMFADLVNSLALPGSVKNTFRVADGDCEYSRRIAAMPERDVNVPLALNDPFLYIHTGGTTATPKICIVPFRQMIWNSFDLIVSSSGALGQVRELVTFPFFHVGGWNTFTPVFHIGGYCVLLRQFDPGQMLELIERERITHFGAVEAMLQFLVRHPRFADTDLNSLLGITSGGAPCSEAVMQPFFDRGIAVAQAYGMTEAGPSNFTYGGLDQDLDQIRSHSDSIGTTFFHCDYQIIDQATGQPVPKGEPGVLCMRSAHNFQEYLGQPERTEQLFLDGGWVYSGDMAREDENGNVYIVGRADNMFISGGENVSPEEIENAVAAHPAVAQAAALGVPDERWGQAAVAVVVIKSGSSVDESELKEHCRQHLAGYKLPRRYVFADSLPLTGAGKLDRKQLKVLYGG